MRPPDQPKVYHIVHVDRLESILSDGCLWSDAMVQSRHCPGTTIGMSSIKNRRLNENFLTCYPDLKVGDCVPFYFCPRAIMLYMIHKANDPELTYRSGQNDILHLECDLRKCVEFTERRGKRWAFTLSNAGSCYFEDRSDLEQLHEINWAAVRATQWSGTGVDAAFKEGKQAEFLIEERLPWGLIERIGIKSQSIYQKVSRILAGKEYRPRLEICPGWYY